MWADSAVETIGGREAARGGAPVGAVVATSGLAGRVEPVRDEHLHLALLDDVLAVLDEREEELDELLDDPALLVVLVAQYGHVAPERLVVYLEGAQDALGGVLAVADGLDVAEDGSDLVAEGAVNNQVVALGGVVLGVVCG